MSKFTTKLAIELLKQPIFLILFIIGILYIIVVIMRLLSSKKKQEHK